MTAPLGARAHEGSLAAPSGPAPPALTPHDTVAMPADALSWTYDPWAERPLAASIAALAVLAMWLGLALLAMPAVYKLGLGAALAAQLLPLLAPCALRAGADGVEVRQLAMSQRLVWAQIGAVQPLAGGVRLTRKRMPAWTAGMSAVLLPMPRVGRAERRAAVEQLWSAHVR
ncbi:MAG: PH domain-containing protein [Candidatus Eisenbacteria bacterium]|nr:PH domain-containing protein [Candidatus Eisenbacteria bacterium]